MHKDLNPIAGELVKTLINIVSEINLKVFTLIVPQYAVFIQLVNSLMS